MFSFLQNIKLLPILDKLSSKHQNMIEELFFDRFYNILINDSIVEEHTDDTVVPRFRKLMKKCKRVDIYFKDYEPMKLKIIDQLRLDEYSHIAKLSSLNLTINEPSNSTTLNHFFGSGQSFYVEELSIKTATFVDIDGLI